ncbi:UNVERIFIED_CONTAM: hypothetical protein K2H54_047427 [Gekko kuhli]
MQNRSKKLRVIPQEGPSILRMSEGVSAAPYKAPRLGLCLYHAIPRKLVCRECCSDLGGLAGSAGSGGVRTAGERIKIKGSPTSSPHPSIRGRKGQDSDCPPRLR